MPKIKIEHQSQIPMEDAIQKIKLFFETDKDLKKMDSNIQCDFSENSTKGLTGKVKGSQFKADLEITKANQGGTSIQVTIDLPLLLTPFKGKIEEMIQRKLTKNLV